ncbi:MAG: DUF4115 domain-containing protein [bacterium]|nr:DUF4115 domain-containing protein [bacterium]
MSKDIGTLLREAREAQGISLEQAQVDTKIRQRYLKALEDGDYRLIPGEAYARGFLRSYAGYLGLDGLELVRRYREEQAPPAEEAPPVRKPAPARSPIRPVAALVGCLVLVAAMTYYFGVLPRHERAPEESPPPQEDVTPVLPVQPEPPPPVVPSPAPPSISREDVEDEVRYRVTGEFLQVTLELADACWLGVTVDGRRVMEQTLPVGKVQVFQASREISMRVGRPGSVFLSINGEELGLLFQDRATSPRTVIITLVE